MMQKKKQDDFEDSEYDWKYQNARNNIYGSHKSFVSSYGGSKVTTRKAGEDDIQEKSSPFKRSAESFLQNLQAKKTSSIDVTKYKEGQRIYHKKFGEGTITKLEKEGDDYKVDIEFTKFGHKRLMAQFAGLEILE